MSFETESEANLRRVTCVMAHSSSATVVDEIFEIERYNPVKHTWFFTKAADRTGNSIKSPHTDAASEPPRTSLTFHPSLKIDDTKWMWTHDWIHDINYSQCDEEGWCYASNLRRLNTHLAQGKSKLKKEPHHFIRRRRWIRTRVRKSVVGPQSIHRSHLLQNVLLRPQGHRESGGGGASDHHGCTTPTTGQEGRLGVEKEESTTLEEKQEIPNHHHALDMDHHENDHPFDDDNHPCNTNTITSEEPRQRVCIHRDSLLSHVFHRRSSDMNSFLHFEFDMEDIAKEGWLGKRGSFSRNWKLRYFILRRDINSLVYLKDNKYYIQLGEIPVNGHTSVISEPTTNSQQFYFTILNGVKQFRLNAPDGSTRADWMSTLSEMIVQCRASFLEGEQDQKQQQYHDALGSRGNHTKSRIRTMFLDKPSSKRKNQKKASSLSPRESSSSSRETSTEDLHRCPNASTCSKCSVERLWKPYGMTCSTMTRPQVRTYVETQIRERTSAYIKLTEDTVLSVLQNVDTLDASIRETTKRTATQLMQSTLRELESLRLKIQFSKTAFLSRIHEESSRSCLTFHYSILKFNRLKRDLYLQAKAWNDSLLIHAQVTLKPVQRISPKGRIPLHWFECDDEALSLGLIDASTTTVASSDASPSNTLETTTTMTTGDRKLNTISSTLAPQEQQLESTFSRPRRHSYQGNAPPSLLRISNNDRALELEESCRRPEIPTRPSFSWSNFGPALERASTHESSSCNTSIATAHGPASLSSSTTVVNANTILSTNESGAERMKRFLDSVSVMGTNSIRLSSSLGQQQHRSPSASSSNPQNQHQHRHSLYATLRPEKNPPVSKTTLGGFCFVLPENLISGHPELPSGIHDFVVFVNDRDVGSIVAFTLCSHAYVDALQEHQTLNHHSSSSTPNSKSPKMNISASFAVEIEQPQETTESLEAYYHTLEPTSDDGPSRHIDLDFSYDKHLSLTNNSNGVKHHVRCVVFFASQFHALRHLLPLGNVGYVESLSESSAWLTSGGKSGAGFSMSHDKRLILKEIPLAEFNMFVHMARGYFRHMARVIKSNRPTVVSKILGVYKVTNSETTTGMYPRVVNIHHSQKKTSYVIVMENILAGLPVISQLYDLKGLVRRRFVEMHHTHHSSDTAAGLNTEREASSSSSSNSQSTTHELDENTSVGSASTHTHADTIIKLFRRRPNKDTLTTSTTTTTTGGRGAVRVLQDGNLMERIPVPVLQSDYDVFLQAVDQDTQFLQEAGVVDYSLLLAFDESSRSLVVGMIDYIHQFDFLKKMESTSKASITFHNPTIISPGPYRRRFYDAMQRYFVGLDQPLVAKITQNATLWNIGMQDIDHRLGRGHDAANHHHHAANSNSNSGLPATRTSRSNTLPDLFVNLWKTNGREAIVEETSSQEGEGEIETTERRLSDSTALVLRLDDSDGLK